jgi:hypothetical protein
MAIQLSVTARNGRLDSIETTVGTAPILRVYTGTAPANVAAAASGTLLAEMTLPSDWLAAASSGSKAKSGTWSVDGQADGTPGHFRVYASDGTTCHMQGTAGVGSGDMSFDATIEDGGTVTVTSFSLTDANS